MKKIICTFFIILFLPYYVLAYSQNIIPGGESIGININSDGLIVVGFYKVNNEYINKNIKVSDRIIKVNDISINSISELTSIINDNIDENNNIKITVKKKKKTIDTTLHLKEDNNELKTGLYIKNNINGVGTLTYIDPYTKIYGSLGHEIVLNETNNRVEVKDGNILESKINSINKSRNGKVGSKNASIYYNKKIGSIKKNIPSGIYGFYTSKIPSKNTLEVGSFDDIKKGEAYILTVTNNNKINKYKIEILDKYNSKKHTSKAFSFKVIDQELINKTGGIVQGMSGSPIIQDGKIIGAVTNVVIDDVTYGYGISIITMLEDGDKIRN